MANITNERDTRARSFSLLYFLLVASVTVYKGGLAGIFTSGANKGKAQAAGDTANMKVVGIFEDSVDNTDDGKGANIRPGCFLFGNSATNALTDDHLFQPCYVEDDQTVSSDKGVNGVEAGVVIEVTSEGVWVLVNPAALAGVTLPSIPQAALVADPAACAELTASAPGALTASAPDALTYGDPAAMNAGAVALTASDPVLDASDITDSTGGTASGTHELVNLSDGSTYANDHAAIENNFATIAAEYNSLKDDTEANEASLEAALDDLVSQKAVLDALIGDVTAVRDALLAAGVDLGALRAPVAANVVDIAALHGTVGDVVTDNVVEKAAIDANNAAIDGGHAALKAVDLMASA